MFTKSETINGITFTNISNVREVFEERGVYLADVTIDHNNGFPVETGIYCARSDDYALTGKWVYQQILDGNFDGEITLMPPCADEEPV
jgi:hypothetical protein